MTRSDRKSNSHAPGGTPPVRSDELKSTRGMFAAVQPVEARPVPSRPSKPPSAFETWGLTRCPEHELRRLEPVVERLSKGFTDARPERFAAYLEEPDALTAYALFFAPQTVARTTAALRGILDRLPPFPDRPLRVLDLGCGLGSAALAAVELLTERTGIAPEMNCVDWSEAALRAVADILPGATVQAGDLRTFVPKGTYDIILSSFAFNEAFPEPAEALACLRRLAAQLTSDAPSFVLLLEPADRTAVPRLHALRAALAEFPLYAPCPHGKTCPMVPTQDGICHDVRRFRPGRSMTLLNRRLRRSVSDVKYALLAFGRAGGPTAEGFGDPEFLRTVGPMDKAKGLLTCRVCMGDGMLHRLELPAAALTAERRHNLLARERGDCAWLDGPLELRRILERGRIQRTADLRFTDEASPDLDADLDGFSFSV